LLLQSAAGLDFEGQGLSIGGNVSDLMTEADQP
jgi:hypothetical protein